MPNDLSTDPDPISGSTSDSTSQSRSPVSCDFVRDYNWAAGGMLAYVLFYLIPVDHSTLLMRIACGSAGWICVVFSILTAFRSMHWVFAVLITFAMAFQPMAVWLVVLIMVVATNQLRNSGYKFGFFGNAKLPPESDVSAPPIANV